jgi:hypothetical protein
MAGGGGTIHRRLYNGWLLGRHRLGKGCWPPWPNSLHAFAWPGECLLVQATEVRGNVTERVDHCTYFEGSNRQE